MRPEKRSSFPSLLLLVSLAVATFPGIDAHAKGSVEPPPIIISTDVAIGLIDTHGGKSLSPVSFNADATYDNDTEVAPQDIDDGLALAMALNLDADDLVDVLAVVPTYGNASLPGQVLAARQITYTLKRRGDIPVVPGASGPVNQILHASPTWFDGTSSRIDGPLGSFRFACVNKGVSVMRKLIGRNTSPVTILAVGPLTDVACLLSTAPETVLKNIKEIIVVASQQEGESVQINGLVVNDFNFRMDPIAGALLLDLSGTKKVPLKLMSFSLTGQTSQTGDVIPFDADNYPGPEEPDAASKESFQWLLAAAAPRNEFWSAIFGTPEGPFDQYALSAVIRPELFDCRPALAYVQQCPFPAWSADYAVDQDGNPTEEPYNTTGNAPGDTEGNACVDHGSEHGGSLSEVPAQLIVTLDLDDQGGLVRGMTGLDGNIPAIDSPAQPVTACLDFASASARKEFEALLKQYTW